jgi:membrane-associated phospholipid phosphatase
VLWRLFVTTPTGQRLDEVALAGSAIGRGRFAAYAHTILDVVSIPFLVVVVLTGVGVAAVRGQWTHAAAVVAVVAGGNLTTQLLKNELLTRPDLGLSAAQLNSLPSGHTTVAASVAAAALLVCPVDWRAGVALAGAAYTCLTGWATMIGGWHRASDVIAAVLVVATWLLLAQAALGGRSGNRVPTDRGTADRVTKDVPTVCLVLGTTGLVTGLPCSGWRSPFLSRHRTGWRWWWPTAVPDSRCSRWCA